jgi:CRISPR-associated RAMP protein (TIGR02581 family)
MSERVDFVSQVRLKSKLRIEAILVFDTAWRIGSGREGQTSDLGVLLDPYGRPLLPGSSIKGRLRQTCESLAPALGLSACLLNFKASKVPCASDVKWFSEVRTQHKLAIEEGPQRHLQWVERNTCDVCKLFGSPVRAAKIRFSDGILLDPGMAIVQVRDGVVIDRDSHTAAEGLKYDYEVVSAGSRFRVAFDLENPTEKDEALLGAALIEWSDGSTLGGFTSRGLGRFHLEQIQLWGVDFDNPQERIRYLSAKSHEERWTNRGDFYAYFEPKISLLLG